jgi:putative endonuclease
MPAPFTYVYILESQSTHGHYYIGRTESLHGRLLYHNAGNVPHTSKFIPWSIKTAIALKNRPRAAALEKYLETHAGRKFAKLHL